MVALTIKQVTSEEAVKQCHTISVKRGETQLFFADSNAYYSDMEKVLETVFCNLSVQSFAITCSDEQYFLAGLSCINGIVIRGMLTNGEDFEVDFGNFYVEAENLFHVKNESEFVGNEDEEYDRTTEWTTEASVNNDSVFYRFFANLAEGCNVSESELDYMLEELAEKCTGSDVEF